MKIKWTDSRKEDSILIKNLSLNYSKKEFCFPRNYTLIEHTWRKQSMISPLKSYKEKNQWHVPIENNLRYPSIKKNLELILCTLYFILIYLSSLEIWKECLTREHTKQQHIICTSLVGRRSNSNLLMFQCWVMVVVFHNILRFMTQ